MALMQAASVTEGGRNNKARVHKWRPRDQVSGKIAVVTHVITFTCTTQLIARTHVSANSCMW